VLASRLVNADQLTACLKSLDDATDDRQLMEGLVSRGLLTRWQAGLIQEGRTQGFILEHYRILEPLGAGGMGQIFRAMDTKSGWQVAVKVLPKKAATQDNIRRFRREGEAAIKVQHPHLVRTYRLGQQGDTYFLVMELVAGMDLAKHITKIGRLTPELTARIGYEVSLALEHARLQGIIHRDVKPSNILLTLQHRVKLTDLGLAKFFGAADESTTDLTRSGAVLGTIDYMAPEQAEDAKRADTRSDIYSLGCTLYKCLTGRAPFEEGTHVQKILAHRDTDPEPITLWNPDVPIELAQAIVRKMMAKSRADRFQTPAEVAGFLQEWARQCDLAVTLLPLPGTSDASSAADSIETGSPTPAQPITPMPRQVTVTCSICGTRVEASSGQFGSKLECPDCGTKIPVPWPKKIVEVPAPQPEISTYDVLPATPNPKPVVGTPDYDLIGAPEVPGLGKWKVPLLLLIGAVVGALIVLGVLALVSMFKSSGT
jgi:serine/threonine protein kinase